ncbi:MAG: Mrp/NBP35 family ATP-binding protein [Phycisphaerales bacterium]
MPLTKPFIQNALRQVELPAGGDLVSSGALAWVAACDAYANIRLSVPAADARARRNIASVVDATIRAEAQAAGFDVAKLGVEFVDEQGGVVERFGQAPTSAEVREEAPKATPKKPAARADNAPPTDAPHLPGVKHVIAVGAGKGGVGKSTVAVMLALALARKGHSVGLLDGDIYGPSLPTMLGLDSLDATVVNNKLQPFLVHGVKAVTLGKMVDPDKPLIWRGPMAHGAFKQLIERTAWGELDYLVIDLPPGTGDVPLTLAQSLSLAGAVIVCTPQKVAQDDATRAAAMFKQLGIDVLGVVENMSYFIGDDGKSYDIFGRGGAEQMAQRLGLPFLAALPINMALRANLDAGRPDKCFDPKTAGGDALPHAIDALAHNLEAQVALASMSRAKPTLSIS